MNNNKTDINGYFEQRIFSQNEESNSNKSKFLSLSKPVGIWELKVGVGVFSGPKKLFFFSFVPFR